MSYLIRSLFSVTFFVLAIWFIGYLAGFHIALVSTLVISLAATLVLNLVMMAFSSNKLA